MRSRQEVMVPALPRMAPHRTLVDLFPLEPSGELSQSDASEHTPLAMRWRWHGSLPADGTPYPPHR
jgi:hypothetical protein